MLLSRLAKSWRGMAAVSMAAVLLDNTALAAPAIGPMRASGPSTISDERAYAGGLTLDEAVAEAEKRYHAKVVKAEARQDGDKTVYELRLLSDDGRVWTIRVDAATGAGL